MSRFIPVAEAAKVPLHRGMTVHIEGKEIALFNIDGVFYALDGQCPHRGGPLGEGMAEEGRVYCPMHGWEFDVKTGACRENAERPARCYPVRVTNGQVEVEI